MEIVAKPAELLALHSVTTELFSTLQEWFTVPTSVTIDLAAIDSDEAIREMTDPIMIMAFAMRKLQALNLLARPGVRTSTDTVVAMVQDITRALLQAPTMRLRLAAETTDWDAAFAGLDDTDDVSHIEQTEGPAVDDADPATERFNELHEQLHVAMYAVVEASDGEIKYLE